jgi:predicted aspartyl protease
MGMRVRGAALRAALVAGAALCAGPAIAECKLLQAAEFHVTLVNNQPLVDAEINGHPVNMLIDTGSWFTMLTRAGAKKLDLHVSSKADMRIYGIGGSDLLSNATLRVLKIGNFSNRDMVIAVSGANLGHRDYVGIIGRDILSNYDVEFDFHNNAMRLFKAVNCKGEEFVYWAKAYSLASRVDASGIRVSAMLNGHKIFAELDSGVSTSIVTTEAAKRAGVSTRREGVQPAGSIDGFARDPVQVAVATFPTLSIGDETVNNAKLRIADLFGPDTVVWFGSRAPVPVRKFPDMLIGADFFYSHRIFVARGRQEIYFTYYGGPIFQVIAPQSAEAPPVKN